MATITKTISPLSGEIKNNPEIIINVINSTFSRGFSVESNGKIYDFTGNGKISEIFSQLNPTEIEAVNKFIKIGTVISVNSVEPDTPLVNTDITDEL